MSGGGSWCKLIAHHLSVQCSAEKLALCNCLTKTLSAKDNECIPFLTHLPTSDLIEKDMDHRQSCERAYSSNVVRL